MSMESKQRPKAVDHAWSPPSAVKEGARAKDFELAIEWLKDAGLIYKVNRCKKALLPLAAYEDFSAFKLFLSDVGLMGAMSNIPAQSLLEGNVLFSDFKGALTEQYVLQQLKEKSSLSIYYWSAENSRGEIDFLVQDEERIILSIIFRICSIRIKNKVHKVVDHKLVSF